MTKQYTISVVVDVPNLACSGEVVDEIEETLQPYVQEAMDEGFNTDDPVPVKVHVVRIERGVGR